jgi:hypothetical protein
LKTTVLLLSEEAADDDLNVKNSLLFLQKTKKRMKKAFML